MRINDGINDNPYVIRKNNIDHYPLMQPIDIFKPAPTAAPVLTPTLTLTQPNVILILPIVTFVSILAVLVSFLLFRRHRKRLSV